MVAAKVTNRLVVRIIECSASTKFVYRSLTAIASSLISVLQVAHMTKNEMQYLDSSLIGPAMLFLNQYFNFFINEYYVLWLCFVSRGNFLHSRETRSSPSRSHDF